MKRRTLILAGLSAIMLSACQVFFVDDSDTSIVQFSASAGDARTKTEYGGDDGSGWELIKWLDTDQVTIHMSYTDEQNASIFDAPKDYGIKPNPDKDGGHISYGGLVPHSDPLRWHGHFVDGKPQEYPHQFYSAYPAGKGDFSESDHSFTFSLPDKQNGTMGRAYMAAVKEFQQPRENNEDKVQLDYYPLVTAVSVTLTNATGETIENLSKEITLSSGKKALAGAFTAVLSTDRDRYIPGAITGTGNAVTVSATANGLEDTEGITVHMFLLPQDYGTSDLTLKVGDTSFPLAVASTKIQTLGSCKKYNISINLKLQNGEITPDPPTLSPGGAQLMLHILRNKRNDAYYPNYSSLQEFIAEYVGYDLPSEPWRVDGDTSPEARAYKELYDSISKKIDEFFNSSFDKADERFDPESEGGHFTEEELKIIQEFLAGVQNSGKVGQDHQISEDIHESDFSWLPSLEDLDIECKNNGERPSIKIKDLPNLHHVNFNQYGDIELSNCGGEEGITIDGLGNANGIQGSITIENLKLNNAPLDWRNQSFEGPIVFNSVTGVEELLFGNAESVAVKNCPDLKRLEVTNGNNLTELTVESIYPADDRTFELSINNANKLEKINLKDIPRFNGGGVSGNSSFILNVTNCSNALSNNVFFRKSGGGTMTSNIVESPNVKTQP